MPAQLDRNLASRLSASWALIGGVLCLAGLLLTGAAVRLLPSVERRDAVVLHDFARLATPRAAPWENVVVSIVDTGPAILLGFVLIAVALARRRLRLAALVAVVPAGACATTELIKALYRVPRYSTMLVPHHFTAHAWPSGHSTAIMSLVLCAVIVAPRRLRTTVAALGALLALGVSFSLLAEKAHFPSDVVGGYLMAGTWTCFGVAALRAIDDRWPANAEARLDLSRHRLLAGMVSQIERIGPTLVRLAGGLAALKSAFGLLAFGVAAALALALIATRAPDALAFAIAHQLMIAAATAIAALALGLSTTLAVALRR